MGALEPAPRDLRQLTASTTPGTLHGGLRFSPGQEVPIDSAPESQEMLRAARAGDVRQLWAALDGYRDRLRRIVSLRMHPGIKGRVDPSDVVQESLMEVSRRLDRFLEEEKMPFFIWVRFLTVQKLQQQHRFHLGAEARDARREVRATVSLGPAASSLQIAQSLVADVLSPSQNLAEAERIALLETVRLFVRSTQQCTSNRHLVGLGAFH